MSYFLRMAHGRPPSGLIFEVETPMGFRVRVGRAAWETLVNVKHPVMAGHESSVREALVAPDEVRVSRSADDVYLFYRAVREGRWSCAVCKRLGRDGFLITAYPTDAVKEGVKVWPR